MDQNPTWSRQTGITMNIGPRLGRHTRAVIGFCVLLAVPCVAGETGRHASPIIELRQYTLRPGQRDVLIDLFEREFVESQEAHGMRILGTFRDLDKPDRFVWIRGFSDMTSRAGGLQAFYSGPVWRAHRKAANATMIDSSNVLLLRVARPGSGLMPPERARPPRGATGPPKSLVAVNIYYFDQAVAADFIDFFESVVKPQLKAAGATIRASYVTETAPNTFPPLPVRENDRVFVWFSTFAGLADYEHYLAKLAGSPDWRTVADTLRKKLKAEPEVLRLRPTPRSEMRD